MRRVSAIATAAALAVLVGAATVLAGEVTVVSVTPDSLSVVQGTSGGFAVSIESISGNVPPNGKNPPTVSYCSEWAIHANGTATCENTGYFTLVKRNYSQFPVAAAEYVGNVVVNVDSSVPCDTVVNLTETLTTLPGSGVDFGSGTLELTRTVTVTVLCQSSSVIGGCSHGYWKNHVSDWPAPYTAMTTLGDVFDLSNFPLLEGVLFTAALEFKGGNTLQDKAQILLRNAVAGVLNAAKTEITYAFTTAQLIAEVDAALASNNAATMLALEEELDEANHGSPYCGYSEPQVQ